MASGIMCTQSDSTQDVDMPIQRAHPAQTVWLLIVTSMMIVTGCGGADSQQSPATDSAVDATQDVAQDLLHDGAIGSTTYHQHARPIIEARCGQCHQEGGSAPFPFNYDPEEWTAGAPWWASLALDAVTSGRMPPWSPADDCRPISGVRALSDGERATLEAWQAEGFVEGDPAIYEPPPPAVSSATSEPDVRAASNTPYVADSTHPDDYRCFLLDVTFPVDRYVVRTDVFPDEVELVHHVIIYIVAEDSVGQVEALDASDDGPGYSCFGSAGVAGDLVAGWVPGSQPFVFPTDSAAKVAAGSRLVMQLHYNTVYLDPELPVPPDQTEAALWLLPQGETPSELLWFQPFANGNIFIEANEPASTHVTDQVFGWNAEVIGVVPHMHRLGTTIFGSTVDLDEVSTCLFDIPKWDFNWQQLYLFEPGSRVFVHGLSRHRMTCVYDNSPSNQASVNGVQKDPTDVVWGDGTFDEMCLNYALLKFPFEAALHTCGNFPWCVDRCEGDFACSLGCASGSGEVCSNCISDAYVGCGKQECVEITTQAEACAGGCQTSKSLVECLVSDCRDEWQAVHECVEPRMKDGTCAEHFDPCDLGS